MHEYIARVLLAFNANGTVKGASQQSITVLDDGRELQGDPAPIEEAALAGILPEVATLAAQIASLIAEKQDLEERLVAAGVELEVVTVSVPQISAMAKLTITNGDITSITVSSKLAGGFRIDTGIYWIFFAEPQPDTNYLALAYDSGEARAYVADADKFIDYFAVTIVDFSGNPVDPASISLEIKRVS